MIRDRALRPGSGLAICLAMALVTSGVASSAAAQEEEAALDQEFETWLGAFITGPIVGDLFTISDLHYRAWDDFSPHWVLVRPGIGLRLMDGMFAVLGYAWTPSFRGRDSVGFTDEHRIWEQWQWEIQDPPSSFRFQLRTRIEQRFRTQVALDVAVRFRQFVRMSIGLDAQRVVWFVLWDEIFFGLNDAGGYARAGFDQNRLFVGWAFQAVPGTLRFELGYFNQWIHRQGNPLGDAVNHAAMLNTYVSWR
jgi:hypothetical protein